MDNNDQVPLPISPISGMLAHSGRAERGDPGARSNPHPDVDYVTRFAAPEFTSICPVTGQPDFAHLVIDYVPDRWLVESKSLKLHLASFRNHGAFHEDCTVRIGKELAALVRPRWAADRRLLVSARRNPDRCVLADRRTAKGVWAPDQGVAPYRGRG